MKLLNRAVAGVTITLVAGAATATPMSVTLVRHHGAIPVLVAVNTHGKVTKVLPSIKMSPKFQRLLTENLDEWITAPAKVKGHAVDSQLIINVALHAAKRKDGKYNVSFAYLSSLPSPWGAAAHWVWRDGYQVALVSDVDTYRSQPMRDYQPVWRPSVQHPTYRPMNQVTAPASHPVQTPTQVAHGGA